MVVSAVIDRNTAIVMRVKQVLLKSLTTLLLLPLLVCSSLAQQEQTLKLSSGKTVRVLAIGPITFTQGPPGLMLKYETDLKVSNKAALRKEAEEVWNLLRKDADNGHFQSAIVSANEKPTGLIFRTSSGYNFVYEKRADGQWHCLEDDRK